MSNSSPDLRGLFRDVALVLGIPFVLLVGFLAWWQPWGPDYEVPRETDVFAVAAGTWDWADAEGFCQKNPHTITFSPDRSVMALAHREAWTDSAGVAHRVAEYEIREHSRHHVRGFIRGETRRTEAGELVVWDLVLTSPDSYRWHRTDWPWGSYTNEVLRCPSEERSHRLDDSAPSRQPA